MTQMTAGACPLIIGFALNDRICTMALQQERLQRIAATKKRIVVYAARTQAVVEKAWFDNQEGDADKDAPLVIVSEGEIKQNASYPLSTSYQVYQDRVAQTRVAYDAVQGPNVYRVYPHKLLCDTALKGRCITNDERGLLYRDDDHLSEHGAKLINSLITKQIDEILNPL